MHKVEVLNFRVIQSKFLGKFLLEAFANHCTMHTFATTLTTVAACLEEGNGTKFGWLLKVLQGDPKKNIFLSTKNNHRVVLQVKVNIKDQM